MNGPGSDQNLMVTGNITFDVRRRGATPPAVQPYLVAGGGFFHHSEDIGSVRFSSSEGSFTAGGGVRVNVNTESTRRPTPGLGGRPTFVSPASSATASVAESGPVRAGRLTS